MRAHRSMRRLANLLSANGHPERIDVIGFQGSFHGRSYAAINASGNPSYLEGFGPKLPGYLQAPFGDIEAVRKLVGPTTAGIIIEPVQGEGGVRAAPDGFLKALRKLADDNGFLLIFDEVQSGAGRTGKLWAHEWAGVTPDVMAVAKGVGGGFPMGAFLATHEAAKGMVKGVHGTTFGGNPLAMAVGNACFDELSKPELLEHVNIVANHLGQALEGVKDRHPNLVVEVRGRGLLRGLKLKIDPKPLQAKLLRVTQLGAFSRVGSNTELQTNARILAATNRNLEEEVKAGRFREDLFYRLNVVPVTIPSLAERRDDIPTLVDHFFARFAADQGVPPPEVTPEAVAALQSYEWPGNVRQLRNVVERTIILTPRDRLARIEADMLPTEVISGRISGDNGMPSLMGVPLREARENFEREYLKVQIKRFSGNISRTASFIGMERSALHRKLKLLGMAGGRDDEETVETAD